MSARGSWMGVLVIAAACEDPVEPVEWDEVDFAQIEAELDSPTGFLPDVEDAPEIPGAAVQVRTAVLSVLDVVAWALGEPGSPTDLGETPSILRAAVESSKGAQIYVVVGCPGPGGMPDPDFAYGEARFDAPSLTDEAPERLRLEGHVLARFFDCEIDDLVIDGTMPLFVRASDRALAARPTLAIREGSLPPIAVDQPLIATADRIAVLQPSPTLGTYTVSITRDGTSLVVRGRNAAIDCEPADDGSVSCD